LTKVSRTCQFGESGDSSGRGVRPHKCRARSHLYWTGKGREVPRVRFLLSIRGRGGTVAEEPERPAETKVE
jgi:hypothetical protein